MKKLVALLLALVMVFLLIGCGANPKEKEAHAQKAEISRGKIENGIYTNDFLGITFTKPQSWIFSTDEEIAALINISAESFLNENLKEILENNPTIYDMMVKDILTNTNINVTFENLEKSFATNITEEQYAEVVKQQYANLTGMSVTFAEEINTVKLGEADFTQIVCSVEAYGVNMTQIYYFRKVDKYMGSVIVTITSGYTVEDIEAMFK